MRKKELLQILKSASSTIDTKNEDWCSIGPAIISTVKEGPPVGGVKINQMIDSLNQSVKSGPSKDERDQLVDELMNMSDEEKIELQKIISSGNPSPGIYKKESLNNNNFDDILLKVADLYGGKDFAKDVVLSWSSYSKHNLIKLSSNQKNNFKYQLNEFKNFVDSKEFVSYVGNKKFIIKEAIFESPKSMFSGMFKDISNIVKRPFPGLIRFLSIIGLLFDVITMIEQTGGIIEASKEIFNNYQDILSDGEALSFSGNIKETFKIIFNNEYLISKAKSFENKPDKMLRLVDFVKIMSKLKACLIRFIGTFINMLTIFVSVASIFTGPVGITIGLILDLALSFGIYASQEKVVIISAEEGLSVVLVKIKEMAEKQIKINCDGYETTKLEEASKSETLTVGNKDFEEEVKEIFSRRPTPIASTTSGSSAGSTQISTEEDPDDDEGYFEIKVRN